MTEIECDHESLTKEIRFMPAKPTFPAPYSPAVVDAMLPRLNGVRGTILDPFAGQGLSLPRFMAKGRRVVGIEIEPPNVEYGTQHGALGLLRHGDATKLPFRKDSIAAVFTSPTYGNRFSDSHNAQERCRECGATGKVGRRKCPKCNGTGHRDHTRRSYTHDIRTLTGDPTYELAENNTGRCGFNDDYRLLHVMAWREVWRVLKPEGLFLLNISDHYRTIRKEPKRVHVTMWHLEVLQALGFSWVDAQPIETPRMRRGANSAARAENEWLLGFRKPAVT